MLQLFRLRVCRRSLHDRGAVTGVLRWQNSSCRLDLRSQLQLQGHLRISSDGAGLGMTWCELVERLSVGMLTARRTQAGARSVGPPVGEVPL
jgi:hypothetical protein